MWPLSPGHRAVLSGGQRSILGMATIGGEDPRKQNMRACCPIVLVTLPCPAMASQGRACLLLLQCNSNTRVSTELTGWRHSLPQDSPHCRPQSQGPRFPGHWYFWLTGYKSVGFPLSPQVPPFRRATHRTQESAVLMITVLFYRIYITNQVRRAINCVLHTHSCEYAKHSLFLYYY